MPRGTIHETFEAHTFYFVDDVHGGYCELPDDLIARYKSAIAAWSQVQGELKLAFEKQESEFMEMVKKEIAEYGEEDES